MEHLHRNFIALNETSYNLIKGTKFYLPSIMLKSLLYIDYICESKK
jgi:hypothetical protein